MSTYIETQFPIARLSAESYKERKAGASQTLTGLGKWWGRKPLILVRAAILGMLIPASDNPQKDREIFLKILTMDDDGTIERWRTDKHFSIAELRALATPDECEHLDELNNQAQEAREKLFRLRESFKGNMQRNTDAKKNAREAVDKAVLKVESHAKKLIEYIDQLQISVFVRLPYAERITRCKRPENITGPSETTWTEINTHLGTAASSLPKLVEQLGQRMFGHTPRVGDCFCGGGSIPFEAARIGCEAFGSDLNPVSGLLTWASLNLLGGGEDVLEEIRRVQEMVFETADRQITTWGIEHNDQGERADAYLYCVEVKPEGCDYYIPLAPSWVISEKYRMVVKWQRVLDLDRLQPKIVTVSADELKHYKDKKDATAVDGRIVDPFDPNRSWSIESVRGPEGLRRWVNEDLVPRPSDIFQERLYCIRWIKTVTDQNGKNKKIRRYAAPDEADIIREDKVHKLLRERFTEWQREGFIPSKAIISGYNTEQPIRERGWTHWHHLFTPRQLLLLGLVMLKANEVVELNLESRVALLLRSGMLADFHSRLCRWDPTLAKSGGIGACIQTFYNQAYNTLSNFGSRSSCGLKAFSIGSFGSIQVRLKGSKVLLTDARDIRENCDLWITDPPYADAVNYHELGDFFLAWYDKQLVKLFPEWIPDARAELAVRGEGESFRHSMVEIYRNLSDHMPDNGLQMVMFTHQNPAVWADLGMILWAAGLKATAAWTISTETQAAGIKKGSYVQGTVCMVLRKRTANEPGFLDEIYPLVEDEVKSQIESMQALDEDGEPNFNDADYQLAAYAAALKVLTQYATLDGRDVEHEVFAVRSKNEKNDFQTVIERALGIACDTLIPHGLDTIWRNLTLVERYYLRALDIESRGERRKGMYEELARGFGVTEIRPLLKSDKANGARMFTPSGFAATGLAPISVADTNTSALPTRQGRTPYGPPHPFAASALRHLLFAIRETYAANNSPEPGCQYLRDTFGQGYWGQRERFVSLLEWFATLGNAEGMDEWRSDSTAARILAGRLRNDHA